MELCCRDCIATSLVLQPRRVGTVRHGAVGTYWTALEALRRWLRFQTTERRVDRMVEPKLWLAPFRWALVLMWWMGTAGGTAEPHALMQEDVDTRQAP